MKSFTLNEFDFFDFIATCVYARGSDTTITDGTDLFLPPQIPGEYLYCEYAKTFSQCYSTTKKLVASTASRKKKPIVVNENDNLRLQCSATGIPRELEI